ncbi:unnamed protein product, partial [Aphanomyces euteiches]
LGIAGLAYYLPEQLGLVPHFNFGGERPPRVDSVSTNPKPSLDIRQMGNSKSAK